MIVDTHVHFIDPTRPQGAPYPDPQEESRLYRTVLPLHFKGITAPLGVTGVVVVEASHWVEDNQWILDMAAGRAADRRLLGQPGHARGLVRGAM